MEHISFDEEAAKLQKNDRVVFTLESGKTYEGTVCKSNKGGIRILSQGGSRLYTVKTTGQVSSTHPDGGSLHRSSRVGRATEIKLLGSGSVKYDREWMHA